MMGNTWLACNTIATLASFCLRAQLIVGFFGQFKAPNWLVTDAWRTASSHMNLARMLLIWFLALYYQKEDRHSGCGLLSPCPWLCHSLPHEIHLAPSPPLCKLFWDWRERQLVHVFNKYIFQSSAKHFLEDFSSCLSFYGLWHRWRVFTVAGFYLILSSCSF